MYTLVIEWENRILRTFDLLILKLKILLTNVVRVLFKKSAERKYVLKLQIKYM